MKEWDRVALDSIGIHQLAFYDYQLLRAIRSGTPILNAACAQDIPDFGRFGAVNLDVRDPDQLRRLGLKIPLNYQQGSVFDMPFPDASFQTVVLGEFLEHCQEEVGNAAVAECTRVLRPGGHLVITLPLDGRPNGHNRAGDPEGTDEEHEGPWERSAFEKERGEWSPGVTVHHQTWWSNKMLWELRVANGLVETDRVSLIYGFTAPVTGWGLTWRKP